MEQVHIVGGLRSYIGVENGMYRNVSAEQLGAHVLNQVVEGSRIPVCDIDWIVAGNGVGAGGNLTRLMMLEAGLPERIPAVTVDVQCGSGLEAVAVAVAKIRGGLADVVIAGGFESCSTKPVRIRNEKHPDYIKDQDNRYDVAKFAPGKPDELAMLRGAENVARAWQMDKSKLHAFVIESHRRAAKAAQEGRLQEILAAPLPVWKDGQTDCHGGIRDGKDGQADCPGGTGDGKDGQTDCSGGVGGGKENLVSSGLKALLRDEGIRPDISEKLLKRLPVLVPGGEYITAGNACLTHDGAAFLLLCSESYLQSHGWRSRARVVDVVSAGCLADRSPESILPAVDRLLLRNYLSAEQITAWEYNEAFAVIDVLMEKHFGTDRGRYNIFGGALAYGHPYGASGGILTLHLLEALKTLELPETADRKYGIAAIAAAGGIGMAMLVER